MRKALWLSLSAAGLLLSAFYLVGNPSKTGNLTTNELAANLLQDPCWNPNASIPLSGKTCGKEQVLQLSCYLPADKERPSSPTDFNVEQRSADLFSWQEFIALNWPAKSGVRGEPDWTKKIGDPGPRVWETWKEEYEIYLPSGQKPQPWNAPQSIPPPCGGNASRVFFRTQKIDDVIDSTVQAVAADGTLPATLTDLHSNLVRYEIRLNKVMFDHIFNLQLYNANAQAGAKSVDFPDGGILIKAAWRQVTPSEEPSFHTVDSCVCDRREDGTLANCQKKRMGLVGFHITQKTPSAPQWIWSTFEQVNNVPGSVAKGPYWFNSPACLNCPVNRQTKRGTPNQIARTAPIPAVDPDCNQPQQGSDNLRVLNGNVRLALKYANSVFQSYELVNTQWPVPQPTVSPSPSTVFSAQPVMLANTTMESFVQPTSSCMGCHSTARSVNPNNFVSSDFSFTLNNAQPQQVSCKIIPPPKVRLPPWTQQQWHEIMLGYRVATHTYEEVPNNVPTARLHCSSCHLNAGSNSDAAWWVDLKSEFPTKPKLQARINQCFTNSLNGKALCTPAGPNQQGDCDSNKYMNGFLAYMNWLDAQAKKMRLCNTVEHGFPPISNLSGKAVDGEQIFMQKCAVCHGLDGQGRYESNTYYRPALWGPHSFNSAAGMFTYPMDLAQFIRWNMPLMAGGQLTDQEAWDLEAFIHSKPRPKLK